MNRTSREKSHPWTALLLTGLLIGAGAAAAADPEREVREVDDRRFAAMVRADTAELDRLLADDLTYTHSTGAVETKAQFLAAISAPTIRYRSIEPSERRVRVYGDAAVITGAAAVQVTSGGQDLALRMRFTAVYVRRAGAWKLAAWQSTRLPEG